MHTFDFMAHKSPFWRIYEPNDTDHRKSEDLYVYLSVHIDGYAKVAYSH